MNNLLKNILLTPMNLFYKINPEQEMKLLYRIKCGYTLDLDHPVTYNEKLQWIKLYDKNPLMAKCCDKYKVRAYVQEKGCGEILNTLLWEGFYPDEIPFSDLPNQFVIKATHGSSFNLVCTDKEKLDAKKTVRLCNRWLKSKYLPCYGEWFYGVERPRIVVERYLSQESGLKDYKVYCFHGIPRYISVDSGRDTREHTKDIYDAEWNLKKGYHMAYPCSGIPEDRPKHLDRLLRYAHLLSNDFLHARIDFYMIKDEIYFGEITFANSAGFGKVYPPEFAIEMGSYINLPSASQRAKEGVQ